jgi:hypothetical protein
MKKRNTSAVQNGEINTEIRNQWVNEILKENNASSTIEKI